MKPLVSGAQAFAARRDHLAAVRATVQATAQSTVQGAVRAELPAAGAQLVTGATAEPPPLPDYVLQTLARLRLLIGVPFSYLAPDPALLPAESIRFFHLDPAWLDELCAGALAVGAGGTREQAQAELAGALAPSELGRHLPLVRDLQRGRGVLEDALAQANLTVDPSADLTGMLVRSSLISGWPSLQVRAYRTDQIAPDANPATLDPALSIPLLRMEILQSSVLLAVFAGVPKLIWLEEPHHGIQLGFEQVAAGLRVPIRLPDGTEAGTVPVPMRDAGLGVVDVAGLRGALDAAASHGAPRGAAGLALALTRAPARQRFAAGAPVGTARAAGGAAIGARA